MLNRSLIFRNANKLVKQGYTRSEAMRRAWELAKLPEIDVKVKGTAATPRRQEALEHLTQYDAELVSYRVVREPSNPADSNAVGVVATVKEKGSFLIGYLARELAADIARLLDAGLALLSSGTVTGGYAPGINYGARVKLRFAQSCRTVRQPRHLKGGEQNDRDAGQGECCQGSYEQPY